MHKHRFNNYLSSDILKQNYHLKNELIETRKTLKEYQEKMIRELQAAAKTINLQIDFLTFQTASQSLQGFIKLLHSTIEKTELYSTILKIKQQEQVINNLKLEEKQQNIVQKIIVIKEITDKLQVSKIQKNNLEQAIEQNKRGYEGQKIGLQQQIDQLKVRLSTLDSQLNLKYMIEKKAVTDKAFKQLMDYRHNVEVKYTATERHLRNQIDKKDKDLKALLQTISNMFDPRTKGKNFKQKQDVEIDTSNVKQPSQAQIRVLQKIIKPFTIYTQLNDKIAQLRKQLSEVQDQNRSLSTRVITSENKQIQLTNQKQILESRLNIVDNKFDKLTRQYATIQEQNNKLKQDMRAMEDYYETKWDNQFGSVRSNLQKKYYKKINDCDLEHKAMMRLLQEQKVAVAAKLTQMTYTIQVISKRNQALETQIEQKKQQISQWKQKKTEIQNQQRESECLHNQQLSIVKYLLNQTISRQNKEIIALKKNVSELKVQIKNNLKFYEEQIDQLNKQNLNNIIQIKQQLKQYYENIIDQKQKYIDNLLLDIKAHKQALEALHRASSIQIQQAKVKWDKMKQIQIKNLKVEFYEEIGKLNDKILQLNLQLSEMKTTIDHQKEERHREEIRYEKNIRQKQLQITQAKREAKDWQKKKSQAQKIVTSKQNAIKLLQYDKRSLQVSVNSRELQISNLNEEIKQFINSRRKWKNDIIKLKKQFEVAFKDLKQLCDQRINYYKSRLWQLQRIADSGIVNNRELQKIRSLTEQKKKLEDRVSMKQAQNLVLHQVKKYYENKARDSDSKLTLKYQLKEPRDNKHPIFVKRPRNKSRNAKIRHLKTQASELHLQQFLHSQVQKKNKSHKANYQSQTSFYPQENSRQKNVQSTVINIKNIAKNNSPSNKTNINPTIITDQELRIDQYSHRSVGKQRGTSSIM